MARSSSKTRCAERAKRARFETYYRLVVLTLGYKASAEQFGPVELLDIAVTAEHLGFDSVAVSDHFHPWRHTDGHAPYAFAWLGALGARTSRIKIGTSVVTPTFRHHPALVAQATATLAVLFPGRVFLGVGSGEAMNETPLGHDFPSPGERLRRLGEAVELMRRLWSEEFVTFEGRYYRTREARLYDRPPTPPPMYMAAGGPKAAELAGRLGDGLIATSGKGDELYSQELLPSFERGARESGRDPARLERMLEVKVSFDTDAERARRDTREWAGLALPGEDRVPDPREMERRSAALPDDKVASRWIVSADPEVHAGQARRYAAMGFTHLVFHAPGRDQKRFLLLYSKEVLPLLRG